MIEFRKTYTDVTGRYGVEFVLNGGREDDIWVYAVTRNPEPATAYYSDYSCWFRIGGYKTVKAAIRGATRKMKQFNVEILFPEQEAV